MLLLLLHLLQDGLLLDFNKIAALLLTETQPELLDPLSLLRRISAPYFFVICIGSINRRLIAMFAR